MNLNAACLPEDRLQQFDFASHNAEAKQAWAALSDGRAYRVPIVLGTNTRYFMFSPQANLKGVGFDRYSEDPDLMFDMQLQFARWKRFNLLQDFELGTPEAWQIAPDFQNYYEAAWFGCGIEYIDGQVPDTRPAFADDPERIMRNGLPDPFGGLFARVKQYVEHFRERAERETYFDRPIRINTSGCCMGTDGPLTVACNVFGPSFVCEAMAVEPDRLQVLLQFITNATIHRIRSWRKYYGMPERLGNFWFADDSLALISEPMFRQHVLPHHKRLCEALSASPTRAIHLCGDATRHFVTLRDELGVREFDTGFPVEFGRLRQQLGPDVRIQGGPHVEFLVSASPDAVRREVQRICTTGVLDGGRFVLREGNNLAPGTPLENTEAMYHAGREFGRIRAN